VRLAVVLACLGAVACAPTNVVLRSNHYRVVVPPAWQVAEQSGGPTEPTVLRVPAAPSAKPGDTLELRLYAWTAPGVIADPTAEATRLLAGREELELEAAAAADERRCGEQVRGFWLLGKPRHAVHLRMKNGHHLVIAAGQARGSLVAAVGYVRDEPPFCDNIVAVDAALTTLATALGRGDDLTRPPDPEIEVPAVAGGGYQPPVFPKQPLLTPDD
jgi:hypothetical protein